MKHPSELGFLAHVRELIFGREQGSGGEKGWTHGTYRNRNRVCLNAALHAAERDLTSREAQYQEPMRTKRGKNAQRYLAEACYELDPKSHGRPWSEPDFSKPLECHSIIVRYNDRRGQTQRGIDKALQVAEKKAWVQWLEENPIDEPDDDEQMPVVIDDLLRDTGKLTKVEGKR